jgi:hypothetical protein
MRNTDAVVTKTEILENVWDAHYDGADNVVEVYVGYVRRKIDIPFGTKTIETVRGVGYRLESGDDRRQWAPELVGCIADESLLGGVPGLDACQHLVHRDGERGDFVTTTRHRSPITEVRGGDVGHP